MISKTTALENPAIKAIMNKRRSNPGFTLLELLIVIAIIAALAVIGFGVSLKMREKANKVTSINSMRQVAMATLAYAGDNNGKLNRVIAAGETNLLNEPISGQADVSVSNTFWGRLHPYLYPDISATSQSAFRIGINQRLLELFNTKDMTTMQGTPFQGFRIYEDTSTLRLPFGFNSKVFESGTTASSDIEKTFRRVHSFENPARVVYFSYGSNIFDQSDGLVAIPPPITNPASQSNIYWYADKTAAFTFLDGHVEVLKPPLARERFE